MTISITEQQAYLMGWAYKIESHPFTEDVKNIMSPDELDCIITGNQTTIVFNNYAIYSLLRGVRRNDFIRGFFDRVGTIDTMTNVTMPISLLTDEMTSILDSVQSSKGIWIGINALEFLSTLYYPGVTNYRIKNYLEFVRWAVPHVDKQTSIPTFNWMKKREDAVAPLKNRFSDSGFDLTVVSKIKEFNNVCYYDTGIAVEPSNGYYFEIVGRSSISKTGWMIANNIGIIDASYRGSIIIALVRVNPAVVEIKLPMRIAQMIPRKLHIMNGVEQTIVSDTTRGTGGFGSSG